MKKEKKKRGEGVVGKLRKELREARADLSHTEAQNHKHMRAVERHRDGELKARSAAEDIGVMIQTVLDVRFPSSDEWKVCGECGQSQQTHHSAEETEESRFLWKLRDRLHELRNHLPCED